MRGRLDSSTCLKKWNRRFREHRGNWETCNAESIRVVNSLEQIMSGIKGDERLEIGRARLVEVDRLLRTLRGLLFRMNNIAEILERIADDESDEDMADEAAVVAHQTWIKRQFEDYILYSTHFAEVHRRHSAVRRWKKGFGEEWDPSSRLMPH